MKLEDIQIGDKLYWVFSYFWAAVEVINVDLDEGIFFLKYLVEGVRPKHNTETLENAKKFHKTKADAIDALNNNCDKACKVALELHSYNSFILMKNNYRDSINRLAMS